MLDVKTNRKLKTWQSWLETWWAALPCEQTNQSRLGFRRGRGLKDTRAKTEHFRQRGEYSAAALDSMRKLLYFLSIKSCKAILVMTKNKIMNPENEHNMSPLNIKKETDVFGQPSTLISSLWPRYNTQATFPGWEKHCHWLQSRRQLLFSLKHYFGRKWAVHNYILWQIRLLIPRIKPLNIGKITCHWMCCIFSSLVGG